MYFEYYYDHGDGKTTLFSTEFCETCNGVAMSPNAVGGISADIPKYHRLGARRWFSSLPPETYYDENTDKTACYGCNGKPPENPNKS